MNKSALRLPRWFSALVGLKQAPFNSPSPAARIARRLRCSPKLSSATTSTAGCSATPRAGASCLGRSTALRHNRRTSALAAALYLVRWLLTGTLLFGIASVIESATAIAPIAALFYLLATLSVPFDLVTALCWVLLRRRDVP